MECNEILGGFCSKLFCRIKTALGSCSLLCCLALIFILPKTAGAQESLFVTYTHHMEETGSLEISTKAVSGFPNGAHTFLGNALEFEYGTKASSDQRILSGHPDNGGGEQRIYRMAD